jgi:hypothetical protein
MTLSDVGKRRRKAARASPRYDEDVYAWAQEQARLLRAGQLTEVDAENVAEEILDVGRNEYDKLESALRILLMHMLKWDHQLDRRSRSWAATIAIQRRHARRQLEENPSLKNRLEEAIANAFADARLAAAGETGISIKAFPATCPYGWDAIETRPFEL